MKSVKSLFVSAALLVITIAVFAGKPRFTTYKLYYDNGTTKVAITDFANLLNGVILTNGSGTNMQISGSASEDLYISSDGTNFTRATTNAF